MHEFNVMWHNASDDGACDVLENMEAYLLNILKDNPCGVDTLIKLALVVYTVPSADDVRALEYLTKAIAIDPQNVKVLLVFGYIKEHYNRLDKETIKKLKDLKSDDPLEKTLILYEQAWHYNFQYCYYGKAKGLYEQQLLESIKTNECVVWPYAHLARFYKGEGALEAACHYYKIALKNVESVGIKKGECIDIANVNDFIDEHIKGTHLSAVNYEILQEALLECEQLKN